jgi:F0F1-type ATP synthase assembly protein I
LMWRLIMIAAAVGAAIGWLLAALTGESKWWVIGWAIAGACVAVEIHRRRTRE